ncbi:MAG: YceI family protein, partial [Planctomycetota bacterium]
IRQVAEQQGVAVSVRDPRSGAPEEIAITPLLVYQNHRGRSIYQGRFTTIDRVRNFLRTSRYAPQKNARLPLESVPVWKNERAQIAAPVKITPLTGARPEGHEDHVFRSEAFAALLSGFQNFKLQESVLLQRADRSFYMDLHPYLAGNGTILISLALFSQFNCIHPLYDNSEDPVARRWSDWRQAFREAGRILESLVRLHIQDPVGGDGFQVVRSKVPLRSWEQLGLSLPEPPPGRASFRTERELPRHWCVDPQLPDAAPQVLFYFQAPLEHYGGEATLVTGDFTVGEDRTLGAASGQIEVDPASVTMGEEELDGEIHKDMLKVERYPTSSFRLTSVSTPEARLVYGETVQTFLYGDFTMKGVTIPVSVRAQLQPIIGEDGEPRLLVNGGFQIRLLETFGILGPPGPKIAGDTLVFEIHLTLKSSSQERASAKGR